MPGHSIYTYADGQPKALPLKCLGELVAINQKLRSATEGIIVRSYLKIMASALPYSTGANQPDGSRIANGTAGFICHGPYTSLAVGEYTGGLYLRRIGSTDIGNLTMDIVGNRGVLELAKREIPTSELMTSIAGLISIDFEVAHDIHDVEIRLWVPEGIEVQLRELVLFRRRALDWCL